MSTLKTGALRGTSGTADTLTLHASDGSVEIPKLKVGSDAAGDVLYHNGTNYVRLAKGTDGQVLKLASGVPSWGSGGTTFTETSSDLNTLTTWHDTWTSDISTARRFKICWTNLANSTNTNEDVRFRFTHANGDISTYHYQYNNNGGATSEPTSSKIQIATWNDSDNLHTGSMELDWVRTVGSTHTYYFKFFDVISNNNEDAYFSGAGTFDSNPECNGFKLFYDNNLAMGSGSYGNFSYFK